MKSTHETHQSTNRCARQVRAWGVQRCRNSHGNATHDRKGETPSSVVIKINNAEHGDVGGMLSMETPVGRGAYVEKREVVESLLHCQVAFAKLQLQKHICKLHM